MNFVIKILTFILIIYSITIYSDNNFQAVLKQQIIKNGYIEPKDLNPPTDRPLVEAGKIIFNSNHTSLTSEISCATCHIINKGGSDGLPVSAAIGGNGEGIERFESGGKLLARNSLSLSGRGALNFKSFFWDGKVINDSGMVISQFGTKIPDDDPFVVAIHLPVVEIREMVDEDEFIHAHKLENVGAAYKVYDAIVQNLIEKESNATKIILGKFNISTNELQYRHYAHAIAEFIRDEFPVKDSKLSNFVKGKAEFTDDEVKGGIIFYGKGGCVNCHSGPHFSDFKFHAIPIPQLGFGKNGFGVDYGRYNTTFNPSDLYKFRTPPLWDVINTPPYGHSGSLISIEDTIHGHFDPLSLISVSNMDSFQRHELYKRIASSNDCAELCGYLSRDEVNKVIAFLNTLTFIETNDEAGRANAKPRNPR